MAVKKKSLWSRLISGSESGSLSHVRCFISYSRMDGESYARALHEFLVKNRVGVFVDSMISPGASWAQVLRDEVDRCDVLFVLLTPAAMTSESMRFEYQFFIDRQRDQRRRLVPIVFGGITDLERIPYSLSMYQWLQEDGAALQSGPSREAKLRILEALGPFEERDYSRIESPSADDPLLPSQLDPAPDVAVPAGVAPAEAASSPSIPAAETRPLNEGKLILVGRGEVGKTSLVRRLTRNSFDGNESKTQGINITTWNVRHNRDTFRLNVWDFGGQEMMHATHQFFLTQRSLYLLVLNGREGGEDIDAEYWLKHIETFGGDSPVIIVQNKVVQHPFELNYRGLQARYPQIRAFVKTDCQQAIGLDELRDHIATTVAGMPEIAMTFPSNWFRVKERLEALESEFMSYEAFVDLCRQCGLRDDADRDTLRWVLHCLGIALNYQDDSRLRETSVLKPEWVTQGIYKILNAERLAERQGELHLKDLVQLLPKKRYPVEKHLFLMELMRKFSLCFAFEDEPDRYLVPELLGKEEPEQTLEFKPEACLNFEYHYGVLPEGLLPRFIVRTHVLSRGQQRWRSGVVLAYEDCTALVKAEPVSRHVTVRVRGGDAPSRRRLLAIIRYDLDRINAEFKDGLNAQPKVPLADQPAFSVDYKKLVAFERQGVATFPEFVGQHVVMVRVSDLLNGVDIEGQRNATLDTQPRLSIFFSYSHKDETLRDELETHLKLLQRQRIIATWHDRKILPGTEWDHAIDHRIEQASIILLLVSADFVASDYIWREEVTRAIERHREHKAWVVPVLLRSCDWQTAPFGELQGLPKDMVPVTAWSDRDAAWTSVAKGLRVIATQPPSPEGWRL